MYYITAKHLDGARADKDIVIELTADLLGQLPALIVALGAAGYYNITVK